MRLACAIVVVATASAFEARASSVDELVREAHMHERTGNEQRALRRYSEALSLDPSSADAYLGLGALRMKLGDPREAERVYSVALAHVPGLHAAIFGRAQARWALQRFSDAAEDLNEFATLEADVNAMKQLATWYGTIGQHAAQLVTWRRILTTAMDENDEKQIREARTLVRALQIIVGPADPVCAPPDREGVRRDLAVIAKRGG